MNKYNLSRKELEELYVSGAKFEDLAKKLGVKNRTHAYIFFDRQLKPDIKLKEARKKRKRLIAMRPKVYFKKRCKECGEWIRQKRRNARYCKKHGTNNARQKRFYWKDPRRYIIYQKLYRRHRTSWVKAKIWSLMCKLTNWLSLQFN